MRKFEKMFNNDFVYLQAFMRSVEHYPLRNALTCTTRKRTWSYVDLNRECNKLAHALTEDGLKKHDVVMCSLFNTAEYVFCWIGIQKAEGIFSPINFRLAEGEIARHLEDSEPRVYIFDADLRGSVEKAIQLSTHKPDRLIMVGGEEPFAGSILYGNYVDGKSEKDLFPSDTGPFDEIVRLYTSGTTGEPKGVPLNNVNNLVRSYDVLMHFPLTPLDKTMNMTPWFHAGGLHSGGPCPSLHAGAELVALKAFTPRAVLDSVEKYRLTFLIGAPANLEFLANTQTKEPRDISSLKGIVTMGAPLSREACLKNHKLLTPNIFNGYGTTETFWNSFLRPYELPGKAGTAGRSCTDDRIRVVKIHEDKAHAEPGDMVAADGSEEGEVIIQTLKAPYRYHNKPEEDGKHYYKGWYFTKDIATWDQDGFITIRGRMDDMIISEGENIHPAQSESVSMEHPKVENCIVVGVPDKARGEVLAAYVIKNGGDLTGKDLFKFLTNHPGLAKFKRPRYVTFTDQLPFTPTGKKKHFVVRQQAMQALERGELKRY